MAAERFSFAGAAALLAVALGCTAVDPFGKKEVFVTPERGAVVSEHPLATKAGLLMLEAGGNAADAAVATALALAVVYPQAGNLGGGGFALWAEPGKPPESLDFREMAPSRYTASLYLDGDGELVKTRSLVTPLAVGVPGSPLGLFELYAKHGSKDVSWARLCESAIRLAEDGFTVDPWLAAILRRTEISLLLRADPGAAETFYPGGQPLKAGDRLVQPRLAQTLRIYAAQGPKGFYKGVVARAIVRDLKDADERSGRVAGSALLSEADLENYVIHWRQPLIGSFRGNQIVAMGPPSSGGVALLQVMGMLEGLPLDVDRADSLRRIELGLDPAPVMGRLGIPSRGDSSSTGDGPSIGDGGVLDQREPTGVSARAVHWWIEAMRRAFADRAAHLGDPDQMEVSVAQLLDPRWIAERRVSIGERADTDVLAWAPSVPDGSGETTHLSVVDDEGNAVSLTTTLNGSFGSGIFVDEAGFLLNNELDDFSIQAGTPNMFGLVGAEANQLHPGRRPLSSMCPVIVRNEEGNVSLVAGSPGGPRIITAVIQVLLRVLVYEQGLVEAIRAPRVHQQWRPMETRLEDGWDPTLVRWLEDLHGQPVLPSDGRYFGSVQAIRVGRDGAVEAYSDPRRGGSGGLENGDVSPPARLPE
ncbi:Gamma-glutamyltranspeptidase precursor [Planctomycetes bacterium Poly30]|uniref:Gamma-glutamyltranspeptidase n=1 Tax=Saltatorellus ferox TaxID=2528018 RepID=A0A518ESK3_9BACT|nr:Gamma-glutamyltranspeptidase precursor [Planctomycetes bacterium Poly30]